MAIAKKNKKGGALCLIIAALLVPLSCKEASRVLTNDVFTAYSGNPPGDFRLLVTAGLPANGSTGVPINSHFVIVFNIPADPATISGGVVITSYPTATGVPITTLAEGAAADYELSMNAENTLLTVSFHYGGAYPLPENTTATITLGNTIMSLITAENPVSVPLDNPGSWQFGTGAFPDTAPPAESAHNPAGAGISLTAPGIYIEFNEDLAPESASPLTLLLLDGATPVPAAVAYDTLTRRASLTPSINLNTSTLYTVTATTGLMDLAGNSFAGTSWTFTTTATSLDPTPGNPAFSSGPYIDTVSPNGALMTWTTNKPASYILNYGMNSGVTDQYDETLEPFPYSEYHSFYFATPELAYDLDPNTRYWFNIELYDMYGGSTTSMATLEFNTESGETPDTVHGGTGSQYGPRKLAHHPLSGGATGFFLFWHNLSGANSQIYGQLYDSGLAVQWTVPDPHPVFTAGSNTFVSSAEDGLAGAIIAALSSDGNYYAKRLADDGSFYWSHTAASAGLTIGNSATISNVSAVPVYSGKTYQAATGVTEMGFMSASNYFFDDDTDLVSSIVNGDIIYDDTAQLGTTAVSTGVDFNYAMGQTDAGIVGAGDTYYAAYGGTFTDLTATDHTIDTTSPPQVGTGTTGAHTSGGSHIYTDHNYAASRPAWLVDATPGEIIRKDSDTTYARITGVTTVTPIDPAGIHSGTTDGGDNTHLWEYWINYSSFVDSGDYVINDSHSPNFSTVNNVYNNVLAYPFVLTDVIQLDSAANFGSGDLYHIFDLYCTNHSTSYYQFTGFDDIALDWGLDVTDANTARIYRSIGPAGVADTLPSNPLCDNEGTFTATVQAGDIVINNTDSTVTPVSSVAYDHAIELQDDIMADNETYTIQHLRETPVDSGRADGGSPSVIHDSTKDFSITVSIGDIAYNPLTYQYAIVTLVETNDLTLDRSIGFGNGVYYAVFSMHGVLFVFQGPTGIEGRVVSMELAVPVVRVPTFTIAAGGTNPWSASDGLGRAFIVYNNAAGQVCASLRNSYGESIWGSATVVDAIAATIVGIAGDGANGVAVLYRRGNDLYAQRINNSGAAVWASPITFDNDAATTVSSQEAWEYVSSDDSVIVAAKDQNDAICSWRTRGTGAAVWAYGAGAPLAGSTGVVMRNPQIFFDTAGSETTIVWEDDRFYNRAHISTGYGIFGQRLDASGNRTWFPNTGGANDANGISIILNHYSDTLNYWPGPVVASYNNGAEAALVWEDYRADVVTPDIVLIQDLELFPPW